MFVKIIKTYRNVVAVCDKELLGKVFEEGIRLLDVKESFYRGEQVSEEKAIEIMKKYFVEDATFNIVGARSVQAALNAGIISEENIGEVSKIPFALTFL